MRIVFSLFVVLVVLCSCYGQKETGIISENSSITPQESPIFNAAREGLTERVMEIIRSGRDVNEANHDGWTALLFAVEAKKLHTIKSLLKNGADPNLRDRDGWSPLMFAAHAGNMAMVRILLDANANPLLANNRGFAAHSIAQFEGYKEVSRLIAERGVVAAMLTEDFVAMMVMLRDGASVNTQSSAGWTPLIAATASGNIDIVKELLEFPDILINQAENDGWTPLLFAANNNRVEITSILLEYGADSTIKSKVGFTAQGIARDRNFPDVVKVLKSAAVLRNEYLKKVYEKQQQSVADFTGGMGGEVDIELETGKSSTLEGKTEIKVLPKVTPQQQQSVEVNNNKKKTGWLW